MMIQNLFATAPWGWRKIVQNGQTAPKPQALGPRRRTQVRREAKFVHSIKHFYFKKCIVWRISTLTS